MPCENAVMKNFREIARLRSRCHYFLVTLHIKLTKAYMKIEINGLGAIKQAQIDLTKKLTVFCGHNNTGKTYVSYVIYALTSKQRFVPKMLAEKYINQLLETGELSFDIDFKEVCQFRQDLVQYIGENLNELFGISKAQADRFFSTFSLSFKTTEEEFKSKIIGEDIQAKVNGESFVINVIKNEGSINVKFSISVTGTLSPRDIDAIRFMILPNLYTAISLYPIPRSIIFPVERNSIYTFSKELSIKRNILIDQMQDLSTKQIDPLDFLFKRTTRYPQPIRDGLEIAEDMNNIQRNESEFKEFAEEIETELLQGKVSVSNEGEVQFASSKAKSKKLPIHLTASIVKTLSSLVFYLKHIARRDDLIIIDEPELNLHPNNQIILTRIFARLVNAGFRLLISTHSDYIIRELNNLIMLSSNNDEVSTIRKRFNYLPSENIPYEEVNAYYFDFRTKTTVGVKPLPVNQYGFEVPSIDDTLDKLNSTSEELYYAIKYPTSNVDIE